MLTILEQDYKVEKHDDYYTLYVLKNKKEKKENPESIFKFYGHYSQLESIFKALYNWRQDKKYTFGKDPKEMLGIIKELKDINKLKMKIFEQKSALLIKFKEAINGVIKSKSGDTQ